MTVAKSNPITGIWLEGFQVFDKPTYIPLDRLTLLFGPNSSGKSSVQDAFELYAVLMSRETVGSFQVHPNVEDLLKRHWRRGGGTEDRRVDKMAFSVVHTTQTDIHSVMGHELRRNIWGEFLARNGHAWVLESRWQFDRDPLDGDDLTFRSCFELSIESTLIARVSQDELIVNLAHPLLCQIEMKVDFVAVANAYPSHFSYSDGRLVIPGYWMDFRPMGPTFEQHESNWMGYANVPGSDDASILGAPLFLSAITELNLLLACILRMANGNSDFRPMNVKASRSVPTRQELTFQFGDLDDEMLPSLPAHSKTYRALADSFACFHLTKQQVHGYPPEYMRRFADQVNHALANHLFIEQGYRIDFDFRVLLSKENSVAAMDGTELNPGQFGFLVELFLRDGSGRRHQFQDVGSGIGYVLPVLCAVYENGPTISTCFIQQPELHIHPALQAAMGDVLIESSAIGPQLIVETHSEHLLLRILKRIRQTHLQASVAPELEVKADDVSVLYFDPSPDGTTSVKRLRISEDGEFMDRWPRGFFAERDQELFDE